MSLFAKSIGSVTLATLPFVIGGWLLAPYLAYFSIGCWLAACVAIVVIDYRYRVSLERYDIQLATELAAHREQLSNSHLEVICPTDYLPSDSRCFYLKDKY